MTDPLPGFEPGARILTSRQAKDRCSNRYQVADGRNRERMWARSARKLGITVAEYLARRVEREAKSKPWPSCPVHILSCIECGELFTSRRANVKLCSDDCRKARHSVSMLAVYHQNPRNWSTANKRRRIFQADDWRCRACGKRVTDTVHKTASNRAVAGHIYAKSTGGEWSDDNMCTLCYPCNVKDGVNQIPLQTRLVIGGSFLEAPPR